MILNVELKNKRITVLTEEIDSDTSTLKIMASDNTELVALKFPNPCALGIENGEVTFNQLSEEMVLITGEASKAEIQYSDGSVIASITVTDENGNGEIKLRRTSLLAGDLIRLTEWKIREL